MQKIRVVIAEDHPSVRWGIRYALNKAPCILVIGEACSGEDALFLAASLLPDVLLLDLEMPGMGGVEVARQIRVKRLPVHILVLSAHDDPEYVRSIFELGVEGYLVKDEPLEKLREAVRGLARGERGWVSRSVIKNMASLLKTSEEESSPLENLTHREIQVLQEVVNGKTNRQIGLLLKISEKTVDLHMTHIFKKLHVASRLQAAMRVVKQGWL